MITTLESLPARSQADLPSEPFDRWVTPDDDVAAEFYRTERGFLARFPEQADFEISIADMHVRAFPAPEIAPDTVQTLYRNSILAVMGNHLGGLNLHGSAVATPFGAIGFMGLSRRGKTTLAGAFAKDGHPFLTEDRLNLELSDGQYLVEPQRPILRLFRDSTSFLLGTSETDGSTDDQDLEDNKMPLDAGHSLPFSTDPAALKAIFILGPGEADRVQITRLSEGEALAGLIENAFVLDVEDKKRLRAHFERIATLAANTPCHLLDYPRSYDQLPDVIATILAHVKGLK